MGHPDNVLPEARTFDEWKARHMVVIKGQKAVGRNADGKATFTRDQVKPNWVCDDEDPDCPMEQWARGEWP